MDELIFFAGALLIGFPLAVIYLLVSQWKLKQRFSVLEKTVSRLRSGVDKPDKAVVSAPTERTEIPKSNATDVLTDDKNAADEKGGTSKAADVIAARRAEALVAAKKNADNREAKPAAPTEPTLFDVLLTRLFNWLSENWFYAVSAVSLALAGLFLVQYGMENGLLPPAARVASALGFGAALIGAGEYIRRRFGEAEDSATAYLPSVFAGAGIVSLFGAVLSAQMLYGLIGANTALIGMILVAGVAMVLGWFYGPLLAAIGVIGAFGAPMVLGGSDSDPTPLFGYYALITAVGLGVDTLRRWAWVSGLTVVLAYVMGTLLIVGDSSLGAPYQMYVVAVAVMAILIPARGFAPDHGGALITEWATRTGGAERPTFPVLLAGVAVTASVLSLWATGAGYADEAEFWISSIALAGLTAVLIIWSLRARIARFVSYTFDWSYADCRRASELDTRSS